MAWSLKFDHSGKSFFICLSALSAKNSIYMTFLMDISITEDEAQCECSMYNILV